MFSAENLSVHYGDAEILKNVSFSLEPGQWLMLAGPNGAGKSTLVSAVSGGTAYNGTVLFDNMDIKTMKSYMLAQKIGVLAQHHSISYAFTVEEVVRLGRYAWSHRPLEAPDQSDLQMIDTALAQTGMLPLRKQSMLTLSGGELQRAFLAQVLAQNPQILILDEPTNHLDLAYQSQVFDILTDWIKAPGRAIISVVHDLSVAKVYGTHALLLHKGSIVARGTVGDVFTAENLDDVYSIDVTAWMQKMLAQWQ